MRPSEDIYELFKRFLENQSSKEDLETLFHYFRHTRKEELRLLIKDELERHDPAPGGQSLAEEEEDRNNEKLQNLYQGISQKISQKDRSKIPFLLRRKSYISVAAACVLFLLSLTIFLNLRESEKRVLQARMQSPVILPGGNKAVLTLDNGKKIVLDDARTGQIANSAGVIVTKTSNGQIVYDLNKSSTHLGSAQKKAFTYNTITTPTGGQFQVILPDGTRVWLNASSSLRFPTSFDHKERRVEMKGEAYFEVAKNKRLPFVVSTPGQTVEVLGTHFNINAYSDEKEIRTTLVEGLVKVSPGHTFQVLKPGQQAVNNRAKRSIYIHPVETEEVIAWKNGLFTFNDTDIESIMRQISRWYNVEIEYHGNVQGKQFAGSVSRYDNVSQLLNMLESTGDIHFKIEGRRITVMP